MMILQWEMIHNDPFFFFFLCFHYAFTMCLYAFPLTMWLLDENDI